MREVGVKVPMVDETNVPDQRNLVWRDARYQLGHQIGRGAFSTVYKAGDEWGNRLVVKIYRADVPKATWQNEARQLQRFRHPNIVFLHGAFEFQGQGHLILEDAGVSLGRAKPQDARRHGALARAAARGMLQALHFIHSAGWVHADINPGNVLVDPATARGTLSLKLCDLGLCFSTSEPPARRTISHWNPPPESLGPAAAGGAGLGPAMDVYAAALVLLELLYGETSVRFGFDEIRAGRPQRFALELGTPLGAALAGALDPDPQRRPTAMQLWRRIREATDHDGSAIGPPRLPDGQT